MSEQTLDLNSFVRLVAEVVGTASVAPEENFFDIGGDSLTAAHLSVLLEERWGRSLDPFAVFSAESLLELYEEFVGIRDASALRSGDDAQELSQWHQT